MTADMRVNAETVNTPLTWEYLRTTSDLAVTNSRT
jgi:hypothetical protein